MNQQYRVAIAGYQSAQKTLSAQQMMVAVIEKAHRQVHKARLARQEKNFELERQERQKALMLLRSLRGVVSPKSAPELSQRLYAFYTWCMQDLRTGQNLAERDQRYGDVLDRLAGLAAEWRGLSSRGSVQEDTENKYLGIA